MTAPTPIPIPTPSVPVRPRQPGDVVFAVALVLNGLYAVELLVDLVRPHNGIDVPAIGIFGDGWPLLPQVECVAIVVGWVIAAVLLLSGRVIPLEPHLLRLAGAIVLLLPFSVYSLGLILGHLGVAFVCVPTTAFALWGIVRMQRYRRMVAWLPLALFGWGALIASGFGGGMNLLAMDNGSAYFSDTNLLVALNHMWTGTFVSAGTCEELGKGAGVALAYLLLRRQFDSVVSGIVLGACAGLGFNFAESVEYIGNSHGAASFEFWVRQSVGILGSHVAFSAVVGAGFGVARQLADPRRRVVAIAAGYVAAAGSHFANDSVLRWFGSQEQKWFHPSATVDVLVVQPLQLVVLQGPLVVLYLLLLRRDLKSQAAGLSEVLRVEAAGGLAVTPTEVPVLLSPGGRLWLRITAFRQYGGLPAYRAVTRLHAAQLDLGTQLWHRARGEVSADAPPDDDLRLTVLRRKGELHDVVTAAPARPAVAA